MWDQRRIITVVKNSRRNDKNGNQPHTYLSGMDMQHRDNGGIYVVGLGGLGVKNVYGVTSAGNLKPSGGPQTTV